MNSKARRFYLLIIAFLATVSTFAQQPYFLKEKTKGAPRYMIRVTNTDTTLYQFSFRYGKMGFYPMLIQTRPLKPGVLLEDKKAKGFWYRVESEQWKAREKLLFVAHPDSSALNYFKEASWMQRYQMLEHEMDSLYPLNTMSIYDGFDVCLEMRDSLLPFEIIKPWVEGRIAPIRAEMVQLYDPMQKTYEYLSGNLSVVTLSELQNGLIQFAGDTLRYREPGRRYVDAILAQTATERPELLFQLEKDLPQYREEMIWQLSHDKAARKALIAYDKKAPFSKEVRKEHRRTVLAATGGTILSLGVDAAAIYGIIWLIRR